VAVIFDHRFIIKDDGGGKWAVVLVNRSATLARTSKRKTFATLFRPLSAAGARASKQPAGADNPALELIWNVVSCIPRGQVSTYGAVARAAGLPGRARQAGFALRMAPEELNLPWHRVLGAGGRIVFPPTSRHFKEQARRLRAEGVPVKDGRVAASAITQLDEL
jgi:methylated-DNA-protein-cysteine methyltransferase related protein